MSKQVYVSNLPIEANGAVPVNVQDQTTPLFDFYFVQEVGSRTTLAANVVLPTNVVTVTSPTGFAIGTYCGMFSGVSGENRYYFGTVTDVAGSVLTLDTPIDFAYEAGDAVVRFTRDLDVDGSSTPQIFSVKGPGTGSPLEVDVTEIDIIAECANPVNLNLFGDRAPLVNGLVLRRTDGPYKNFWNIKQNSDMALLGEWTPYTALNPAQGVDGFKFVYDVAGQENRGVTIRLGALEGLDLIIQDSLLVFDKLHAIASGHEVTD